MTAPASSPAILEAPVVSPCGAGFSLRGASAPPARYRLPQFSIHHRDTETQRNTTRPLPAPSGKRTAIAPLKLLVHHRDTETQRNTTRSVSERLGRTTSLAPPRLLVHHRDTETQRNTTRSVSERLGRTTSLAPSRLLVHRRDTEKNCCALNAFLRALRSLSALEFPRKTRSHDPSRPPFFLGFPLCLCVSVVNNSFLRRTNIES